MNNNATRAVTHSLPTDSCPVCQAPYNGVINIIDQQNRGPRESDVVVCPGCRTFLVFKLITDFIFFMGAYRRPMLGPQRLKLNELTDDEIAELPQEVKDALRLARTELRAVHEHVKKRAEVAANQFIEELDKLMKKQGSERGEDQLSELLRWLKDES